MTVRTVVVFCMPERGHVQRSLPVIEALHARGCRVAVFTGQDYAGVVSQAGGQFHDLFAEGPLEAVDAESMPRPSRYVTFAACRLAPVGRRVAALDPDLLVYDTFAVIARLIGRDLNLPAVNLCAGHAMVPSRMLAALVGNPRVRTADVCHEAVARLREELGWQEASPFSYLDGLSSVLNLYGEPSQFLHAEDAAALAPLAFFGALSGAMCQSPVPVRERWARRPCRVLIAWGTVVWHYFTELAEVRLRTLVEVLAASGCDLLISTGGHRLSADTCAVLEAAGARVRRWLDQRAVLQEVDVLVTHQGLNSTHEAIWYGVPMLSCPFFSDQPALARRCQELGLAAPLVSDPSDPIDPLTLRSALRGLELDADGYRQCLEIARGWELETIAGRPAVVDRLLALV